MTNKENEFRQAFQNTQAKARKDLANATKTEYANPELGEYYDQVLMSVDSIVAELSNRNQSVEAVYEKNKAEAHIIISTFEYALDTYTGTDQEIAQGIVDRTKQQLEQVENNQAALAKQLQIFKDVATYLKGSKTIDENGKVVVDNAAVLMAELFLACQGR